MRARYPDVEDWVGRDGVRLGFEVFGRGDTTVLLLPTWTIIHSRLWKMQVHYLARHFRVVTYDGPGNGRSDQILDPARYTPAGKRPFLYFPLAHHLKQNFPVRYRFDRYGAAAHMDFATTTCESLAVAIITTVGQPGGYRNVKTDGADRVARMIAELI